MVEYWVELLKLGGERRLLNEVTHYTLDLKQRSDVSLICLFSAVGFRKSKWKLLKQCIVRRTQEKKVFRQAKYLYFRSRDDCRLKSQKVEGTRIE